MWLNYIKDSKEAVSGDWRMHDFVNGGALPFSEEPTGLADTREIIEISRIAITIDKLLHRRRWKKMRHVQRSILPQCNY